MSRIPEGTRTVTEKDEKYGAPGGTVPIRPWNECSRILAKFDNAHKVLRRARPQVYLNLLGCSKMRRIFVSA